MDQSSIEAALCDPERLAALDETMLLDRPPSPSLDRLTRIASQALDASIAIVTLIDDRRPFFSSEVGLGEPLKSQREGEMSHTFCKYVVAERAPLIVEDARVHPVVRDSPAIQQYGVLAYAGMPIRTHDGHVLGSFCVVDTKTRTWTERQLAILTDLAGAVSEEMDLRRRTLRAEHLLGVLTDRMLAEQQADAQRTSAVVHDLQGPLGALSLDVDHLRDHMTLEQHAELAALLGTVRTSVEQATRLLTSIGEKVAGQPSVVDVGPCVRAVCGEWRAARESIRLEVDVARSAPVALTSAQLRRCLEGLLANAERFASSRVLVRVDVRDGEVALFVEDDGPGLTSLQAYQSVWDVHRTQWREGKTGSAAGLAVVKDVVVHAGGHVHARKSELGGARFALYLPVCT